jgi:hypothetical protein
MNRRLILSLIAIAFFPGCHSAVFQGYRYSGEGTFREITKWVPGKEIPGFEIRFAEFDLSAAYEAEYKLGRLPQVPGNVIRLGLAVRYASRKEQDTYTMRSARCEAGLPYEPAQAPWTGWMQVTLMDDSGRKIWETTDRIEHMLALGEWLGSRNSTWEVPGDVNTAFVLRVRYSPEPSGAQLQRMAHLVVRAGGLL